MWEKVIAVYFKYSQGRWARKGGKDREGPWHWAILFRHLGELVQNALVGCYTARRIALTV